MRANINKRLAQASIGVLLGGVTILAPGCSHPSMVLHTDPPPPYVTYYDESPGADVAPPPAPPVVYYDYDYYPDFNVYYYPPEDTYYWYDNGRWRSGRHLPPRYTVSAARHERLHSRSQKPWEEEQKPFEGSGKPADQFGEQP